MARPANPYSAILKRLTLLQAKADKLNAEIAFVTKMVADESAKISKPKTVVKKTAVKKASEPKTAKSKKVSTEKLGKTGTTKAREVKKTRRGTKVLSKEALEEMNMPRKPDGSPDLLAMLNWDGVTPMRTSRAAQALKSKAKKA